VDIGTKIVIHLKAENSEYANEATIKEVVKKYSNFVGTDVRY
jgi:TNF receptor-associated protein 1